MAQKTVCKNRKYVWLTGTVIWILIIWGHSMMPSSVSSEESNFVLYCLNALLNSFGWHLTAFFVRKAGHFTEFFILGCLLRKTIPLLSRRISFPEIPVLLLGLGTALLDEGIQHFTPGRATALSDAFIDLSGVTAALILLLCFRTLAGYFRRKK